MKINLIAIGNKMPGWVHEGYQEYAKRLPSDFQLILHEIPANKRGKNIDLARIQQKEAEAMLAKISPHDFVIALDERGKLFSTQQLAEQFNRWLPQGHDIAILIGGPEGMPTACLQRANLKLSLSPLTFPHPMVRIILAEQLYRVHTLIQGHPYHRD